MPPDDDEQRTPPRTPSSALHRLNLQDGAKKRMREIARDLVAIHLYPDDEEGRLRHVRILGEELGRLIDTL